MVTISLEIVGLTWKYWYGEHHERYNKLGGSTFVADDDINQCLFILQDILQDVSNGSKSLSDYTLPMPTGIRYDEYDDVILNIEEERTKLDAMIASMNVEQLAIYNKIIMSCNLQ